MKYIKTSYSIKENSSALFSSQSVNKLKSLGSKINKNGWQR